MFYLYPGKIVGAILALLFLIPVFFSPPSYTLSLGPTAPLRYIALSVRHNGEEVVVDEQLRDLTVFRSNYTVAGYARLSVNNTNVLATGNVTIKYTGQSSQVYLKTIADVTYRTIYINKTTMLYHAVLELVSLASSNTSLRHKAESYIIYDRASVPMILYNITGTSSSAAYLLDAMVRKFLLFPLLATNIIESRREVGGNTTITGKASAGNVALAAEGRTHIVMGSIETNISRQLNILSMRLEYNISASYGEPLSEIIGKIMRIGIGSYTGMNGAILVLGTYIQGISPVMQRATAHVLNDIVAESLVMNWTRLELVFDANNDSYVMGARYAAENASAADLPTVFLASNLAARGYSASSITSLLFILNTLFNGSRADPVAVLEKAGQVLGEPIYSLSQDIYMAPSKSVLETSTAINESSKEILGELEEILGIETNITVTEHEVIIQPFPSLKEDIAIYMALKNISPTTITITSTGARTTTMPPQTTTKSPLLTTPPKTTTTKTLQSHTVAAPQKPAAPTQTMTATTPISREGSSGVTPLIIVLIPIIAFALLILILHIRAKKRVTEELIEELEETPEQDRTARKHRGRYEQGHHGITREYQSSSRSAKTIV